MAIKLSDCNKNELLFIIDYLKKHFLTNANYYLLGALNEVERKRELKRLDDADRYSEISHGKRMEAFEILKEYDGKPIKDIPADVLQKAQKCLREAEKYDKKWDEVTQ